MTSSSSHRTRRLPPRPTLLVPLLALLFPAQPVVSQPILQTPWNRMHGIGENEFLIGSWGGAMPDTLETDRSFGRMWQWLHAMGINVVRANSDIYWLTQYDSLVWSSHRRRSDTLEVTDRIIASHASEIYNEAAWAGQTVFFLMPDTIRQPSWKSVFTALSGGATELNQGGELNYFDRTAGERVYSASNTTAGQTVASGIAYDWRDYQVYRFRYNDVTGQVYPDSAVHDATGMLAGRRFSSTYNVTVTGHLFQPTGPEPPLDASILEIEVWYEVPAGVGFPGGENGEQTVVDHNQSFQCTTLVVRRQDLYPDEAPPLWDQYRTVSLPVDLALCDGCPSGLGPLHANSASQRVDLRVRWTGADKVAVRSVAIRDEKAELLLGSTTQSAAYRSALVDTMKRRLWGPSWHDSSTTSGVTLEQFRQDSLRRCVIALGIGIEQAPWNADAYAAIERLVKDNFTYGIGGQSDSIPGWTEQGPMQTPPLHEAYHPEAVVAEIGWTRGAEYIGWMQDHLSTPHNALPSILSHNGGRFKIPLLAIDSTSYASSLQAVEDFETTLQRFYGQYAPYRLPGILESDFPVLGLGRSAQQSRRTNRRLILVPFNTGEIYFNYHPNYGPRNRDTNVSHFPEAAELRMMVGLGLTYGSTGVVWQVLHAQNNFMQGQQTIDGETFWYGGNDSYGSNGPFSPDTSTDWIASFPLMTKDPVTLRYGLGSRHVDTLESFYVGWRTRTIETKRINAWLRNQIGPELMKLRWRDGYSMHLADTQEYAVPIYSQHPLTHEWNTLVVWLKPTPRPLPGTEIITNVTTAHPRTGLADAGNRTFVELGFFETKGDSSAAIGDTMHVMVTNRRTFERPTDIPATSMLGHLMDSLAETRTIALKLNLEDHGQYRLVRVQEIAADSTPLPGTDVLREPLDTVLYAKGTVRITLGPGTAALLRITELPPADSIRDSDLRHSNQRKLLFDGWRYHAIYHRYNPSDSSGRIDTIFYSRSYPIADTLGSIRWEPVEYPVSTYFDSLQGPSMTYGNRHPSVTLRTKDADTALSVVWTAEDNPEHWWRRRVLLRNIHSDTGTAPATMTPWIETVNTYVGSPDSAWGTPVIARLHAGEMIVHSDSALGIIARFRATGSGAQWWNNCGGYSTTMAVTPEPASPLMGRLPSMPTFAHVEGRDSNVAIVWQQPYPGRTDILYKRLWHSPGLTLLQTPTLKLNVMTGQHCHPSIDQLQDPWRECQEITTWEGRTAGSITQAIYSRATFTDNRATWDYDSVGTSGAFYEVMLHGRKNLAADAWPNISAIFARDLANPPVRHPITSVSFNGYYSSSDSTMYEARVDYYLSTFTGPKTYTHGGRYQNGSACQDSGLGQQYRHAVLYRSTQPQNPLLTTREYFLARSRPTGYVADGRYLAIALNDSTGSQLTMRVHDIWYADDANSSPLPLAPRPAQLGRIDSLAQLNALLRSASFAGHDSTRVSLQIGGRFAGDTLGWSRARLTVVADLMDSATQLSAARLDSFVVSTVDTSERTIERTLDLLSGTYFVRVSIDTAGFVPVSTATQEPYRLGVITEFVPSSLGKLVRSGPAAGTDLRISVQPNPADRTAEVRFSVHDALHVRVRLTDLWGRDIRVLLDEPELTAGRYVLPVDVSGLAPGAYIVEVVTDRSAVRCKLSVSGR